jgi:hypothetical protein
LFGIQTYIEKQTIKSSRGFRRLVVNRIALRGHVELTGCHRKGVGVILCRHLYLIDIGIDGGTKVTLNIALSECAIVDAEGTNLSLEGSGGRGALV